MEKEKPTGGFTMMGDTQTAMVTLILFGMMAVIIGGVYGWHESQLHQYHLAITQLNELNATPLGNGVYAITLGNNVSKVFCMSFDSVVYSTKTVHTLDWWWFPVITSKNMYLVPVPDVDTKTIKTQKIPVENVSLAQLGEIVSKVGVVYYDSAHLFIPLRVNNTRFVVAYSLPTPLNEYYKISSVQIVGDYARVILSPAS